VDTEKLNDKEKNFWEEPIFYFIVGAILLSSSGYFLRSLGVDISDEGIEEIIGSVVIFSIVTAVLIFGVNNYKFIRSILGILILIGFIFGVIGWLIALPATTIIIILLVLILLKS
jgi:hypothetical protein